MSHLFSSTTSFRSGISGLLGQANNLQPVVPGSNPTGPAGGDLTGTYPNPDLISIGGATGTFGSASNIPVITRDAKGRITAITQTPVTVPPAPAAVKAHCQLARFGSASFVSGAAIPWNRTPSNTGFTFGANQEVIIPTSGFLMVNFHGYTAAAIAPALFYRLRRLGDTNWTAQVVDSRPTGVGEERTYDLNIVIPVIAGQQWYMEGSGFIAGDTNEFSWQSWVTFTLL